MKAKAKIRGLVIEAEGDGVDVALKALKSMFTAPKIDAEEAYKRGYDCGKNGPNETNCHFGCFASKELMQEWERGKKDATKKTRTPAT